MAQATIWATHSAGEVWPSVMAGFSAPNHTVIVNSEKLIVELLRETYVVKGQELMDNPMYCIFREPDPHWGCANEIFWISPQFKMFETRPGHSWRIAMCQSYGSAPPGSTRIPMGIPVGIPQVRTCISSSKAWKNLYRSRSSSAKSQPQKQAAQQETANGALIEVHVMSHVCV